MGCVSGSNYKLCLMAIHAHTSLHVVSTTLKEAYTIHACTHNSQVYMRKRASQRHTLRLLLGSSTSKVPSAPCRTNNSAPAHVLLLTCIGLSNSAHGKDYREVLSHNG